MQILFNSHGQTAISISGWTCNVILFILCPVFLSRDGGRKVVTRVASAGPEPESEYRLTPGPLRGSETMKAGARKLGGAELVSVWDQTKTNFHCIP